jgi:sugar diacid utilization regulator
MADKAIQPQVTALEAGPGPGPDLRRENMALRKLVTAYRYLSDLATQNGDLRSIAQLIAGSAQATVAVVSPALAILAAAQPGGTEDSAAERVRDDVVHPRLGEVLRAAEAARRALRFPDPDGRTTVIVAPVLVGNAVAAYVLVLDAPGPSGEDSTLLLTEHAATICGVIVGREHIVAHAAGQARGDLVEGLLAGRGEPDELRRWARHLGYDTDADHQVLCVLLDPAPGPDGAAAAADGPAGPDAVSRAAALAERLAVVQAPDAIIAQRDDEIVVVLPVYDGAAPPGRAVRLGELCLSRLAEQAPAVTATVCVGGICRDAGTIARSYGQARRTADTLRRLRVHSSVVAFDDLGVRRLLLEVPGIGQLRDFARDVLGGLMTGDSDAASAYLATLACYFRENSSLRKVAASMHVHPNTVSYRIRRAQDLTGLDFSSYRDRLMAQVALEILDTIGASA